MVKVTSENYKAPKKVLVFNAEKILILIGRSVRTIAKAYGVSTQGISYAATGRLISSGGLYFRYIPDDIEVDVEDIGVLKLAEWDKLCGIERRVFRTRIMRSSQKNNLLKNK